jgi:TonB family protein
MTLIGTTIGAAQDVPRSINGGVLNGKAMNLPKPEFPSDAKAAGVDGVVRVQVTIDGAGTVESAKAVADDEECDKGEAAGISSRCLGLYSLRAAAENAAMEARFSPTLLSGNPVKVTGVIAYNFIAESRSRPSEMGGTVLPGPNNDVLNHRAVELPSPEYPAAAKAVRADGIVTVAVVVDEEGNVISAAATSGHPLLRASAVKAARSARFSPTQLHGQPVKVSGTLTYNFVLPLEN